MRPMRSSACVGVLADADDRDIEDADLGELGDGSDVGFAGRDDVPEAGNDERGLFEVLRALVG